MQVAAIVGREGADLMRISRQLGEHSNRFQLPSFGLRGGPDHIVKEHTRLARLVADRATDGAQPCRPRSRPRSSSSSPARWLRIRPGSASR